jgi:hypothetical protein
LHLVFSIHQRGRSVPLDWDRSQIYDVDSVDTGDEAASRWSPFEHDAIDHRHLQALHSRSTDRRQHVPRQHIERALVA